MKSFLKVMVFVVILALSGIVQADDSPPNSINSLGISMSVAKNYLRYTRIKVIGACFWLEVTPYGPKVSTTLALDEYLPDLVVSVYNEAGNNPWTEARVSLDSASHSVGNMAVQLITGNELTNGRNTSVHGIQHNDSDITKSVDVIGSPFGLFSFPFVSLRYDPAPFMPYYQSDLDSIPSRMGLAEALRLETWNPFGHYIGKGFLDHWGNEFPRVMTTTNDNDFKASFVLAQRAADIVTNKNIGHVVNSTMNSCGENCAVANVIEENDEKHEIWQEIYPLNRHIKPGESDAASITPIGQQDYKEGHGNYVFMVWRHYRGCVQHSGKLIASTVKVSLTVKR